MFLPIVKKAQAGHRYEDEKASHESIGSKPRAMSRVFIDCCKVRLVVIFPMTLTRSPIFCATFLLALFAFTDRGDGQTYEGRELVKTQLLADTTAIVPGKPFTVGLLLKMVP